MSLFVKDFILSTKKSGCKEKIDSIGAKELGDISKIVFTVDVLVDLI